MSKKIFNKDELINDPRIIKAKELINETVSEYQNLYANKVSEPKKSINRKLKQFNQLRGNNLFFPYVSSGLGKGSKVVLLDGSVKIDFINGIGSHFGHSLELVRNASINSAIEDTIMQGNLQQNERSFELMKLLIETSKMDHCILTSSGAMANENALKLLFHNQPNKNRLLAFEKCFMGRTISLANITDKAKYRTGIPQTLHIDYIPFYNNNYHEKSITTTVNHLKKLLKRHPNQHAGMCMELIQGEGGYNIGNTDFFKQIINVLKEENIPVFIDEVQTFGRTSELFSAQHFNIIESADIITIGKLSQVCATIYKKKLKPNAGIISQTFTSSTTAIETGYQIIHYLLNNKHFGKTGKNMSYGNYFNSLLCSLNKKRRNSVNGPFGLGGMIAFTPFDGNPKKVSDLLLQLFNNGLMGFTTGDNPLRIRFLLPLGAINKTDIEEAIQIIDKTINEIK